MGADERTEGQADTEFRGVLFWVNLARKDKQAAPNALVLQPDQIPVRREGEAVVRVLVGEGSPVRLGMPALILDIELPTGGQVTTPVPAGFQGCHRRRMGGPRRTRRYAWVIGVPTFSGPDVLLDRKMT